MNQDRIRTIISSLQSCITELESELNQPSYDARLHDEVVLFEEWYDDPDV